MNNQNGDITIEMEDGKPVLVEVGAAIENIAAHVDGLNERVRVLWEIVELQQVALRTLGGLLANHQKILEAMQKPEVQQRPRPTPSGLLN